MEPPKNVKVIENLTSLYWFDEDGILCSISKKAPKQSFEETKRVVEDFKKMLNGKKVCLLIDVTHTVESTREVRDYVAAEFPKFIKAIAMISNSALGKMLANLFFSIKSQPYPTKMFNNEKEAKEWLKQYL
ncbi:MAG: DUF7793 family protein [Bacteroidia bacterium]